MFTNGTIGVNHDFSSGDARIPGRPSYDKASCGIYMNPGFRRNPAGINDRLYDRTAYKRVQQLMGNCLSVLCGHNNTVNAHRFPCLVVLHRNLGFAVRI